MERGSLDEHFIWSGAGAVRDEEKRLFFHRGRGGGGGSMPILYTFCLSRYHIGARVPTSGTYIGTYHSFMTAKHRSGAISGEG